MSLVEEALSSQREAWHEITERVSRISSRELSPEAPKRILLFGVGSSHYAARLTAYSILRDKTRSRLPVVACNSMAVSSEVVPQKGDWVFAFTHHGTTRPTIKALEYAEQAGAFTVQVSAQGVTEHPSAKYFLPTCAPEKCEPHTRSVTSAICAVTCLLQGTKVLEEWDALRSIPSPDLDLCRRRAGQGPSVLVGEWEAEWIAREAALKFMEMARLPVRVFGSEEYFHGPRLSVTDKDPLWHISLPKDSRNNEIQASYRISVYGGSPLAWMPALLELQWLAYATALNREVDPDGPKQS